MRGILIIGLCMFQLGVFAQVTFYAQTDARQIVAGQYFSVSFVLENAQSRDFTPPDFKSFIVGAGPSTSQQMSIVNGRRSQKMSYTYQLTADSPGTYTIGSATINVNGSTYKSEPVTIDVVKGRNRPYGAKGSVSSDSPFIVEAIMDYDTGYVGQQLLLKYNLLTTADVRSWDFRQLPSFDGFFAQELQGYSGRAIRVVRDGVQYIQRTIKVFALFPQQKGSFEIEPATVDLGISDGRSSNSFFFSRRLRAQRTRTSGLSILIDGLPPGAPISFSGAVGAFQMTNTIDKKTVSLDDAVTLTMQVRGYADGKMIAAPIQPFGDDFDVYDPNIIQETQSVIGDRIQYTRTYEYLMVPKRPGTIQFRPEFSYFDIDSASYVTLAPIEHSVRVLNSSGRELADVESQGLQLPPFYDVKRVYPVDKIFAFSPLHIALNGGLIIAGICLLVLRRRKFKDDAIDPEIKRQQKALATAKARLSIANEALEKGDTTQFYIDLRKGLLDYLADRTSTKSSQLSKDQIQTLLNNNNLNDLYPQTKSVLEKGEQALYASMVPGDEHHIYRDTLHLVQQIELALSA
ncbi:MAG: BatD family protein [Bacteroidota bacterium]